MIEIAGRSPRQLHPPHVRHRVCWVVSTWGDSGLGFAAPAKKRLRPARSPRSVDLSWLALRAPHFAPSSSCSSQGCGSRFRAGCPRSGSQRSASAPPRAQVCTQVRPLRPSTASVARARMRRDSMRPIVRRGSRARSRSPSKSSRRCRVPPIRCARPSSVRRTPAGRRRHAPSPSSRTPRGSGFVTSPVG